jgi:ERCC4-type nuclease
LECKGGVRLRWSSSIGQTAAIIDSLYRWWGKDWARHKSLDVVYTPSPPTLGLVEPSLVRKVAVQLPGVGWDKAAAVDARFGSVAEMVAATPRDWAALKGFGKVLAARVVRCLHGEKQ